MVQQLEDENRGIYNDSSKTFIDLYMKSGLYITEVVKRLYNSEVIKSEIPDDYFNRTHYELKSPFEMTDIINVVKIDTPEVKIKLRKQDENNTE